MALKLSPREISRQLANSNLTRSDCALLRPMAVKSSFSIQELTACDYPKMVSRPKCYFPLAVNSLNKAQKLGLGVGVTHTGGLRRASSPLPSLRINNSNESQKEDEKREVLIPSWVRKSEFIVKSNLSAMVEKHGIDRIGFLTLTFADDVQNHKEATKRFNSLNAGVLDERYLDWIRVSERTKKGRWHFHLVVVCKQDIRRGVDFEAIKNRNYKSASPALRSEWAFWRNTAKRYGFGRSELLPVKKTGQALANYVAKYISKGFAFRRFEDKGMRLVSYSRKARVCGSRFSFFSLKAFMWRKKVAAWVAGYDSAFAQVAVSNGFSELAPLSYDEIPKIFGKRWAYQYRDEILATRFDLTLAQFNHFFMLPKGMYLPEYPTT